MFAKWRILFKKLLYASALEINFQDIWEFVGAFSESGLPECEEIEYKGWRPDNASNLGGFSEKVVKEIVAMANTNGGLIFIGIEEEKDKLEGGRRDYPGTVGTLPVSEANRLKQSIEDKCSSTIKPSWFPEMLMVKASEVDKGVLIIRADLDKVERPLLYQVSENKWLPFIRSGRQITLPSWYDIVKIAEGRIDNGFPQRINEAIRFHLRPNAEPFIWCSLGLVMYKRRFCEEEPWTDKERRKLKSVTESPLASLLECRNVFPWRQLFHSRYELFSGGLSRRNLPEVEMDSTLKSVYFTPLTIGEFLERRSEVNKCYRLIFSSRGYMVGTVGLSKQKYRNLDIGTIFRVIFFLADTFLREEVLKCYQKTFRT